MENPPKPPVLLILLGIIVVIWIVLTLVALVGSISGGNPLYLPVAGGHVPVLSMFGKVYFVSSILMPFVVIGAIASA
jgi:hypothetical protein